MTGKTKLTPMSEKNARERFDHVHPPGRKPTDKADAKLDQDELRRVLWDRFKAELKRDGWVVVP